MTVMEGDCGLRLVKLSSTFPSENGTSVSQHLLLLAPTDCQPLHQFRVFHTAPPTYTVTTKRLVETKIAGRAATRQHDDNA